MKFTSFLASAIDLRTLREVSKVGAKLIKINTIRIETRFSHLLRYEVFP